MSRKTVKISLYVYDKLMEIKSRENHQTFDSVIRILLKNRKMEE